MFKFSKYFKAFSLLAIFLGALLGKMVLNYAPSAQWGHPNRVLVASAQSTDSVESAVHSISFKSRRRNEFTHFRNGLLISDDRFFLPLFCVNSQEEAGIPRFPDADIQDRLRPPTLHFAG